MRKLEIRSAEFMRIAVQDEMLRSEESRYEHRLHGILLVCSGFSCTKVAGLLGQGRRTVSYSAKTGQVNKVESFVENGPGRKHG